VKPYYQDSAVTIFHGDNREIVPGLTGIGAVVTDPPYGIHYSPGGGGGGIRRKDGSRYAKSFTGDDVVFGDNQAFNPSWILALNLPTVLWGGNHYASRLPDSSAWLVWDKRDGTSRNDFADCELAWTNTGKVARVLRHMWNGMLRDSERGTPRLHPTQKPLVVMRWSIIELGVPPGAVILDPFAGSGTTGRAAKDLGRKAVLIEIEERYCEIAARRMAQEVLPFDMAPAKPQQEMQPALDMASATTEGAVQ